MVVRRRPVPPVGITLSGAASARFVETQLPRIGCVEVAAVGFFARPSPYLSLLGQRTDVLVRATMTSFGPDGTRRQHHDTLLADLAAAAQARVVVYPLGFRSSDGLALPSAIPLSYTPQTLADTTAQLSRAITAHGRAALVEPVFSVLRVPGTLHEADFLTRLCEATGTRLLVDVATLLARARNHGGDAQAWIRRLPPSLIGAVRVSALATRGGRWYPDAEGDLDDEAWALLDRLLAHARPNLVLLQHELADEAQSIRELDRLEKAASVLRDLGPTNGILQAPSLRASDGVALFVLDHEGVCYSAERQELSLFNTAATFVWCLMDEGQTVAEISAAFARTFEIAPEDAGRQVGTILRQWYGLGYIDDPGPLDADDVPLSTALGQMLTNRRLRAAFRASPFVLASTLGVNEADVDAFVALDPDELDAQAGEFAHAAAVADTRRRTPSAIAAAPTLAATTDALYVRLASTTFAVDAGAGPVRDALRGALAHLACAPGRADVVLAVRQPEAGGWLVTDGSRIVSDGLRLDSLVPAIKQLIRQWALDRHPALLSVHAGIVSLGEACVLMPAVAGSGKTTLTAGLAHAGAVYFSDEIALLDEDTLLATPVPLAFTIKDGAVAPLRAKYPELDELPVHVREDGVRVRYLAPPLASLPAHGARQPVRWIVFPRYDASRATAITPLDRPAALRRLLDESYVDRRGLRRDGVESLVHWLRGVDCYDLTVGSLDDAIATIRELAGRTLEGNIEG